MKARAFKGATAWEGYVGRLWWRVPFWTYLRLGCRPQIGWERDDD